jgi:hypothetical protein
VKNESIMIQYISYSLISREPTFQLGGNYYIIMQLSLEYT